MKRFLILLLFISWPALHVLPLDGEITIRVDTIIGNACNSGNEAAIHITVEGGTSPYTYSWTGPGEYISDQEDIENLIEGQYLLTVTDQNDSTTLWDTIILDPIPISTIYETSYFGSGFQVKCKGDSTGWIEIDTVQGNGPDSLYAYAWEGPGGFLSNDRTIDSLLAGDYYVTVTDTLGCKDTLTITLMEPEALSYDIEGLKDVQCHGPGEGYLKIAAEGGHGSYSYQWSGALTSDSDSLGDLVLGKYFFEITDIVGCVIFDSLTLSESDLVVISVDSLLQNPCLGLQQAALYLSASGGEIPYQYHWSGPNNYTSQLEDIENLHEGFYSLSLEDARGCIYSMDTAIVDKDPISVSYTVSQYDDFNTLCHGDSTGSIHVDTVAGNGLDWKNFTYIWTGPDGYKAYEYQIHAVPAGNYHLNVFDSVNCRSDITISLVAPPPILINYDSVINNPCIEDNNGAFYINVSGGDAPYTFQWAGPDAFTSTEQNILGLPKGHYSVTARDSKGCSVITDSTLILVDEISLTVETSVFGDYSVLCNGSRDGFIKIKSITGYVDISDFYFYTTGPYGFTSPFRFMTNLGAGLYHLSVSDSLGCTSEQDVILTEPPRISTGPISGSETFIEDTNYIYTLQDSSSGSTYTWTVEGGEIWSGQGSPSIAVEWRTTDSGSINVLETDENGCTGDPVIMETEFYADIDTTTSNPAMHSENFRVYPVPAGRILHIAGLENLNGSIEMYSLTGTLVLKEILQEQVDITHLDPGVYYLLARDQRGRVLETSRIIKY